jgi:hypothetical protein
MMTEVKAGHTAGRNSCIGFLRKLYVQDPLVANIRALKLLRARFPQSNANVRSIITWKNILRSEGIDIPLQVEKK